MGTNNDWMRFDRIAADQGWDANSVEAILRSFIEEQGLNGSLVAYATQAAKNENATGDPFEED